jgi:hypothetical protein
VCVFKRVPTPVRRSSQVCNVWVSEGGLDHYVHGLQQQVRLKTCS